MWIFCRSLTLSIGLALLVGITPGASSNLASVVKKYDRKFEKFTATQGPGIAFMVVKDQKVIHQKGYGNYPRVACNIHAWCSWRIMNLENMSRTMG